MDSSQADISHQEVGYTHSAKPGVWWDSSFQVSIGIRILVTRKLSLLGRGAGVYSPGPALATLHHFDWRQTGREQRRQEQAFKWAISTHADTNTTA